MSPIQSSAITRSRGLEWFATVSVELSVHTGNSHPESLQHEQFGRTFMVVQYGDSERIVAR
jgi:hypothetical protein